MHYYNIHTTYRVSDVAEPGEAVLRPVRDGGAACGTGVLLIGGALLLLILLLGRGGAVGESAALGPRCVAGESALAGEWRA